MHKIFKFEPHYFERIWGGRALETILGRNIPVKQNIGESWEIVDRDDCQSVLTHSEGESITLRELLQDQHQSIMGPGWKVEDKFPVLVKWLDCSERLSLQVHPPKSVADLMFGEPKTENWYVAHSTAQAGLFVGLKFGTTKKKFIKALNENKLEAVCQRIKSPTGDSILVNSGSIHAIDGGNLILEIQQNSDTTYRVYDWGRKDKTGCTRKLHIKESLRCINFNDFEPEITSTNHSQVQILAECNHFRIRKFTFPKPMKLKLKNLQQQCMILNPLFSDISVGKEVIPAGTLALSPYAEDCEVQINQPGEMILTDNFFIPQTNSK